MKVIFYIKMQIIYCARSKELINKMSPNELENVIATGKGLQKVLEIVTVLWYHWGRMRGLVYLRDFKEKFTSKQNIKF